VKLFALSGYGMKLVEAAAKGKPPRVFVGGYYNCPGC